MTPMPGIPAAAGANPILDLLAEAKALAKDIPELQAILDQIQSFLVPPVPATPEAALADPSVLGTVL